MMLPLPATWQPRCLLTPLHATCLFFSHVFLFPQMMITGDQALTACHVAAQVHIMERPALILTPSTVGAPTPALGAGPGAHKEDALFHFDWLSPDELTRMPFRCPFQTRKL